MAIANNKDLTHVVRTTQQWQSSYDKYECIPEGVLCIEFTTSGQALAKIGNGRDIFSKLPYIGGADLTNYFTKQETTACINEILKAKKYICIKGILQSKDRLPDKAEYGDLYFVISNNQSSSNKYDEYVYSPSNTWEPLGSIPIDIDLSEYAKIQYVDEKIEQVNDRIDDIEQHGTHTHANKDILDLITAAFTAEEKDKLSTLYNYDDTELRELITQASHTHSNKDILDAISAAFTTEDRTKLDSLTPYDDSILKEKITALERLAHEHSNKRVLDRTTASFTTEYERKMRWIRLYTGCTGMEEGIAGLVPAAQAGEEDYVLSGAGEWVPQTGGGGTYELPIATASTLGGVIVGEGINVDEYGEISLSAGEGLDIDVVSTLPSAYTQVKAISSTLNGNQYIDTGYKFNSNAVIKITGVFYKRNSSAAWAIPLGTRSNHNYADNGILLVTTWSDSVGPSGSTPDTPGLWISRSITNYPPSDKINDFYNDIIEIEITLNTLTYTNTRTGVQATITADASVTTTPNNLYLFATNDGGSANFFGVMDLYSFQIFEGSAEVIHYVPCKRNSDNVYGVYDMVNDEFKVSPNNALFSYVQGTPTGEDLIQQIKLLPATANTIGGVKQGDGILVDNDGTISVDPTIIPEVPTYEAGKGIEITNYSADLPIGYSPLAYIESTGSEYLVLDYLTQTNTRVIIDMISYETDDEDEAIFGTRNGSGGNPQFVCWVCNGSSNRVISSFIYGNSTWSQDYNTPVNVGDRFILDASSNGLYINNTLIQAITGTGNMPSNELALFACFKNGVYEKGAGKYRVFSIKIYEDSTLMLDLVPTFNETTQKPGLYDLINDDFYPSSTNTDFVYSSEGITSFKINTKVSQGLTYDAYNNLSVNYGEGLSIDPLTGALFVDGQLPEGTIIKKLTYTGNGSATANNIQFEKKPIAILSIYGSAGTNYIASNPAPIDAPYLMGDYGGVSNNNTCSCAMSYNDSTNVLTLSPSYGTSGDEGFLYNINNRNYTVFYLVKGHTDSGTSATNEVSVVKMISYTGTGTSTNNIQLPETPDYILGINGRDGVSGDMVVFPFDPNHPSSAHQYIYTYCYNSGISTNYCEGGHGEFTFNSSTNILTLTGGDQGAACNYTDRVYYLRYVVNEVISRSTSTNYIAGDGIKISELNDGSSAIYADKIRMEITGIKSLSQSGTGAPYLQMRNVEFSDASNNPIIISSGTAIWSDGSTVTYASASEELDDMIADTAKMRVEHFDGTKSLILTFNLSSAISYDDIQYFRFKTGNDISERDPISWKIYFNNTNSISNWNLAGEVTDAPITNTRSTWTSYYPLACNGFNSFVISTTGETSAAYMDTIAEAHTQSLALSGLSCVVPAKKFVRISVYGENKRSTGDKINEMILSTSNSSADYSSSANLIKQVTGNEMTTLYYNNSLFSETLYLWVSANASATYTNAMAMEILEGPGSSDRRPPNT